MLAGLQPACTTLEERVDGCTPLFIACQDGHLAAAAALRQAGADAERLDHHGATPFYSAVQTLPPAR